MRKVESKGEWKWRLEKWSQRTQHIFVRNDYASCSGHFANEVRSHVSIEMFRMMLLEHYEEEPTLHFKPCCWELPGKVAIWTTENYDEKIF